MALSEEQENLRNEKWYGRELLCGTEDKDKKLVHFIVEEEDSRTAIQEDDDFSKNVCWNDWLSLASGVAWRWILWHSVQDSDLSRGQLTLHTQKGKISEALCSLKLQNRSLREESHVSALATGKCSQQGQKNRRKRWPNCGSLQYGRIQVKQSQQHFYVSNGE